MSYNYIILTITTSLLLVMIVQLGKVVVANYYLSSITNSLEVRLIFVIGHYQVDKYPLVITWTSCAGDVI